MKRKKFLGLVIAIALLIIGFNFLTFAPPHQPQTSQQIKGVWLTHVGNSALSYGGLTNKAFHKLSQENFNTIYVDVYNRGVTYPSKQAPRNNWISFPFTNPLKTAIKAGKSQGLNIYAWYEYGMMAGLDDGLATQHPEWLLSTPQGEQYIEQHLWLDPNNPEVQEYFRNLLVEVAENYPQLAGIQLDDHWGIPAIFGNYQQAMTELTRNVTEAVRQINPNLIISLSPNPYGFSRKKYSQDWMLWLKEGFFDELVLQIYRDDSQSVRQSTITSGIREASNYVNVAVGLFAGGEPKLKPIKEIRQQIQTVETLNYGYSIFCWEYYLPIMRKLVMLVRNLR